MNFYYIGTFSHPIHIGKNGLINVGDTGGWTDEHGYPPKTRHIVAIDNYIWLIDCLVRGYAPENTEIKVDLELILELKGIMGLDPREEYNEIITRKVKADGYRRIWTDHTGRWYEDVLISELENPPDTPYNRFLGILFEEIQIEINKEILEEIGYKTKEHVMTEIDKAATIKFIGWT